MQEYHLNPMGLPPSSVLPLYSQVSSCFCMICQLWRGSGVWNEKHWSMDKNGLQKCLATHLSSIPTSFQNSALIFFSSVWISKKILIRMTVHKQSATSSDSNPIPSPFLKYCSLCPKNPARVSSPPLLTVLQTVDSSKYMLNQQCMGQSSVSNCQTSVLSRSKNPTQEMWPQYSNYLLPTWNATKKICTCWSTLIEIFTLLSNHPPTLPNHFAPVTHSSNDHSSTYFLRKAKGWCEIKPIFQQIMQPHPSPSHPLSCMLTQETLIVQKILHYYILIQQLRNILNALF